MATDHDIDQREADSHARASAEAGFERDDRDSPLTRGWLDLKLAAFRSEMRLLFVIAVAGNQLLAHISIGTTVGAIGGGVYVAGAALKALLIR